MKDVYKNTVQGFSQLMLQKLNENVHKGHWEHDELSALLTWLKDEVREIEEAITLDCSAKDIGLECADVANIAMMIADNVGAIRPADAVSLSDKHGNPIEQTLKVYGASDDLIEIDSDKASGEELYPKRDKDNILKFSDGTELSVCYNNEGLWKLDIVKVGKATVQKTFIATDPDSREYSDVITLTGTFGWVSQKK